MKDQQAIKKIQLLKTLHPTKNTLRKIRESVYYQVQSEHKTQASLSIQERFSTIAALIKSSGVTFYAGMIAFLFIISLSAFVLVFPNQTHTAFLYGRLVFAPNQYEKAHIALEDTKSRFANNNTAQSNANELVYSLTFTNTQLDELKLKGENGKYTAQECHQIYQEYLTYLESTEKSISSNNSTLKSQINAYEEQAEKKLHMYNSL